jgi:creatinine amidohydrolase/Fe(II)-dependent formamide hydrolase-like protein
MRSLSAGRLLGAFALAACASLAAAQAPAPSPRPGASSRAGSPDPEMPRPIAAVDSVFLEELTWLEIRDALRAGKRTAIVATGGIEMNGPYLVLGKHNVILRATTQAIARKLGDALVAPIVAFVPEGQIEPPSGHMRYPGTISLSETTYKALLTDIAASLKAHGFRNIVLIGDSGGNQKGMREVAEELQKRWAEAETRIVFIPEYYDYPGILKWVEAQGIKEVDEGHHDDFGISAMMMSVDPSSVRMKQRMAAGRFSINGVSLAPAEKTIALGKRAVEFRADVTVAAIRKALVR